MYQKFECFMPPFQENRTIHVYMPDTNKRYPVLYMFDGHNLFFDQDATYGRSWRWGDNLERLHRECIVVGQECSHHNNDRLSEYGPYPFYAPGIDQSFDGWGDKTMEFFTQTLKPLIDKGYPTLPNRKNTWIGGSSCGGLMAYYAGMKYSAIYSKAVCVSPYFLPTINQLYRDTQNTKIRKSTDFYFSWGAKEMGAHGFVEETKDILDLATLLSQRGHRITFNVKPDGEHCERDWEAEIPAICEFLWTDPSK